MGPAGTSSGPGWRICSAGAGAGLPAALVLVLVLVCLQRWCWCWSACSAGAGAGLPAALVLVLVCLTLGAAAEISSSLSPWCEIFSAGQRCRWPRGP